MWRNIWTRHKKLYLLSNLILLRLFCKVRILLFSSPSFSWNSKPAQYCINKLNKTYTANLSNNQKPAEKANPPRSAQISIGQKSFFPLKSDRLLFRRIKRFESTFGKVLRSVPKLDDIWKISAFDVQRFSNKQSKCLNLTFVFSRSRCFVDFNFTIYDIDEFQKSQNILIESIKLPSKMIYMLGSRCLDSVALARLWCSRMARKWFMAILLDSMVWMSMSCVPFPHVSIEARAILFHYQRLVLSSTRGKEKKVSAGRRTRRERKPFYC